MSNDISKKAEQESKSWATILKGLPPESQKILENPERLQKLIAVLSHNENKTKEYVSNDKQTNNQKEYETLKNDKNNTNKKANTAFESQNEFISTKSEVLPSIFDNSNKPDKLTNTNNDTNLPINVLSRRSKPVRVKNKNNDGWCINFY